MCEFFRHHLLLKGWMTKLQVMYIKYCISKVEKVFAIPVRTGRLFPQKKMGLFGFAKCESSLSLNRKCNSAASRGNNWASWIYFTGKRAAFKKHKNLLKIKLFSNFYLYNLKQHGSLLILVFKSPLSPVETFWAILSKEWSVEDPKSTLL